MEDSSPEIAELIQRVDDIETEEEMNDLFGLMRAVNLPGSRQLDEYLAKKGVPRRRRKRAAAEEDPVESFQSMLDELRSDEPTSEPEHDV